MEISIHPAFYAHDAELRVFSPRASFSFEIRRLFVLWGGGRGLSPPYYVTTARQQQPQPNVFAVIIIVAALGRLLCLLSSPAAS